MSGSGYNSYAAGSKTYRGGSSAPHYGPVDITGYRTRELKRKTRMRNNAILQRLKAKQKKRYASSEYLSAPENRTV